MSSSIDKVKSLTLETPLTVRIILPSTSAIAASAEISKYASTAKLNVAPQLLSHDLTVSLVSPCVITCSFAWSVSSRSIKWKKVFSSG